MSALRAGLDTCAELVAALKVQRGVDVAIGEVGRGEGSAELLLDAADA
jgi:hypothetical protein